MKLYERSTNAHSQPSCQLLKHETIKLSVGFPIGTIQAHNAEVQEKCLDFNLVKVLKRHLVHFINRRNIILVIVY